MQILTAGGCLAACAIGPAVAADISGAGATFPFPIYAKWADAYKKETGIGVTYRSIGSGDGIRQIQAKEVTFGASDMPLNGADLELHGLVQFPTVVGGVVAVVNIEGVKTGDLTLDGPTLARIFLGEIRSWNDAALRKLNPSVKLPSQAITVVRRSDGSGTTFAFTDYLSKVSAIGRPGSDRSPPSIGRSESAPGETRALPSPLPAPRDRSDMSNTPMPRRTGSPPPGSINKAGKAVAPAIASFAAAASNANWEASPGFGVILTNESGAEIWPITGATFVLMHKQPTDPVAASEALKFFNWAYASGGKMAEELHYVPMPASVIGAVQKLWASEIKGADGKPLFVIAK